MSRETRDLTDALDALMRRKINGLDNSDNSMPAPKDRGESPPQTSSQLDALGESNSGKGINSPLTETAWADREFYADTVVPSSDGIFMLRIAQIKTQKFTDSAGKNVEFRYKDKPA